jgi:hypothetical protein
VTVSNQISGIGIAKGRVCTPDIISLSTEPSGKCINAKVSWRNGGSRHLAYIVNVAFRLVVGVFKRQICFLNYSGNEWGMFGK